MKPVDFLGPKEKAQLRKAKIREKRVLRASLRTNAVNLESLFSELSAKLESLSTDPVIVHHVDDYSFKTIKKLTNKLCYSCLRSGSTVQCVPLLDENGVRLIPTSHQLMLADGIISKWNADLSNQSSSSILSIGESRLQNERSVVDESDGSIDDEST